MFKSKFDIPSRCAGFVSCKSICSEEGVSVNMCCSFICDGCIDAKGTSVGSCPLCVDSPHALLCCPISDGSTEPGSSCRCDRRPSLRLFSSRAVKDSTSVGLPSEPLVTYAWEFSAGPESRYDSFFLAAHTENDKWQFLALTQRLDNKHKNPENSSISLSDR